MTTEPPIPRTLYKYVDSIDAVKSIIQGRIKFASFYELNDATETTSVVDFNLNEKSLVELQLKGVTELQLDKLKAIISFLFEAGIGGYNRITDLESANKYFRKLLPETDDILLKKLAEVFKGRLRPKDKLALHYFCLSERYDSLPMWAHYAKRGLGFVVVFNDLKDQFDQPEPWKFNGLHRVRYCAVRPPITHDPDTLENLFLTKTDDWKYEKEIRVIKPAKDLKKLVLDRNQLLPMKYFEVHPKHVTGVIFGYKIPEHIKIVYKKEINELQQDVYISTAELQADGKVHLKAGVKIEH